MANRELTRGECIVVVVLSVLVVIILVATRSVFYH